MDPEPAPFSAELRRYLGLLKQWAWLLALAGLLAGGGAYLTSKRATPVYRATAIVLVDEAPSMYGTDYYSLITSEYLAGTYAKVMTTRPVLEGVVQRLDLDSLSVGALGGIQVQPVRDTQLIRVQVEHTNPSLAALVANALVAEFAEQNQAEQASRFAASRQNLEAQLAQLDVQIQADRAALESLQAEANEQAERDRLETVLAQSNQTYSLLLQIYEEVRLAEAETSSTILLKEPAVPPAAPVRPQPLRNGLLGAAVGLLLSVGVIFLVEALDDTLHDPGEAARLLGLPVLGLIARHETPNGRPVSAVQPRSADAEAFRSLRTNLQFASLDRPLRTLLVTSPAPEEGKSTVIANLGVVLAQGGSRTVLLEADLRRPKLHKLLGLPNREGISSLFLKLQQTPPGELDLERYLLPVYGPRLRVLTSGSLPPNPAELLGSENMQWILGQVSAGADTVLVDSPPVLAVTDAAVLAPYVDGVLLVVKPGATRRAACLQAVEQLRRVGANLLGIVLNDVDPRALRYACYHFRGYPYPSPAGQEATLLELNDSPLSR